MGNQSSSEGGSRTFGRSGNSLGLSRSELEKRCRPSGLYSNCKWDEKAIRKLVGDGKLASRMEGLDYASGDCNQECPICFLNYKEVNRTKCCGANICTECYLQVRPQKDKQSCCPFCNAPKVSVTVAKKLSSEQVEQQKKEEERVLEVRKRSHSMGDNTSGEGSSENHFGSSLVAMERARSKSFASAGSENINPSDTTMPMSLQERQRLETELRAQLSHPLTMRVEAEAAERRMENDRSYASSHRQDRWNRFRRRRSRGNGLDWNQIVDAFERGGNGQIHSLDDLVVLEAAILLSMGEEARSGGEGPAFDPARHARDGFPLVRNYFAIRGANEETAESSSVLENQSPSAALDTAALLMRGISEEDQVAMAIAASLQDQGNGEEAAPREEEEEDLDDGQSGSSGSSRGDDEISSRSSGSSHGGDEISSRSSGISRGDDEISEVAEDLEEDDHYDEYTDDDLSTDGEDRAYGGDGEAFDVEDDDEEETMEAGEPLPAPESGDEDESHAVNEVPEGINTVPEEGTNTDNLEG